VLPSGSTILRRFGSIVDVANLLELPAARDKARESYYEGDLGEYIKAIKSYIKNNNPDQVELKRAIAEGKIPGVNSSIYKHHQDLIDRLKLKEKLYKYSTESKYSDEEIIKKIEEAFESGREQNIKNYPASSTGKPFFYLSRLEYDNMRKSGVLKNAPSSQLLTKKFGPYWENVLSWFELNKNSQ
jgi:hypothetical protein